MFITFEGLEGTGKTTQINKLADYLSAKKIIENDPMIKNNLVIWDLQEWISIDGSQPKFSNHLG